MDTEYEQYDVCSIQRLKLKRSEHAGKEFSHGFRRHRGSNGYRVPCDRSLETLDLIALDLSLHSYMFYRKLKFNGRHNMKLPEMAKDHTRSNSLVTGLLFA